MQVKDCAARSYRSFHTCRSSLCCSGCCSSTCCFYCWAYDSFARRRLRERDHRETSHRLARRTEINDSGSLVFIILASTRLLSQLTNLFSATQTRQVSTPEDHV